MFNFMKKGDEKEKRKKEKDGKKKRERDGISSDETARFDEVRRSLKIRRKKEKLPSGITADYTGNLFADMNRDLEANRSGSLPGYASRSDSSEASVNSLPQAPAKVLPPLPPRPPKRGILKGARNNVQETYDPQDINNPMVLFKNTLQNEVITYQNIDKPTTPLFLSTNEQPKLLSVASSAESLTDTTNSSFATPPLLSPTDHPPLPPIIPLDLPPPRRLTIYRTARGDFGFQLRRAIVTDKLIGTLRKEVLFAEPGTLGGHTSDTGLLPGDVLLEVNSQSVQDKTREEIIGMIKNSGASVIVQVQPIGELSEITRRCRPSMVDQPDNVSVSVGGTLKRSASLRFRSTKARSDDELAKEKEWLETEKLWLVHRSGFSAARAVPNSPATDSGKVKARLESSEEILEVQEEDLERANPPKLDAVENLSELRYINESSILHTLRQRFGNNLIHTYAAGNLIVINPECPLSIYNEKVASLFLGCDTDDMPPHIYASAQAAYRAMVHTRRDQSIVLLGRSGSGKTHNFRHLLSYILMAAGSANKAVTMEKLNALHLVLEAFGNAKTLQNINATRCTNLISIDFDQSRQVAAASIQIIMLEKSRVARRPIGESSFHAFYYLLAGAEGSLSKQLFLDSVATGDNSFINPVTKNDERQKCQMDFSKLCLALANLGVSEKESSVLWSILAAIYHLGHAGVVQVGTAKWQFLDPVSASRAARLLGATSDELAAALWDAPLSPTRSGTGSPKQKDVLPGADALEGFVVALYAELVNVINAILNRCLSSNVNTTASLVILDAPGFQCPGGPGTFNDLCHNYVQERLHLLHHNSTLLAPLDRYTQERVNVKIEELYTEQISPSQLVALLDKPPPGGVLKTSQTDLRDADRRGLLWLTEEETVYPNSSDDTLLQHIFNQYGTKEFTQYIKRWSGTGQLCIQHLQGNFPVVYNVRGWLRTCREPRTSRTALALLQESSREDVSELFVVGRGGGGMFSPEGASPSLRRVSSIRRTCSAAVKRKSLGLQVKHTTDSVIETLRRTRVRFVFCLSPQQWSGLGDGVPSSTASTLVNIPLLRSQVRAVEVLPAVRLFKQGYPEHLPHSEFVRRFRLLAGGDATPIIPVPASPVQSEPPKVMVSSPNGVTTADEGRLVAEILFRADVDEVAFRIGLSEVFLRAGILSQLETQRDEKLSSVVVSLQSHCRGFIARKKLEKLRIQDTAVRCIQRNVRKLMQVQEWSWWKLYVKISPLLKVRSNEEELAARMREIETIRVRLEKLEADNVSLRLEKDKLESKINKALWKKKPKEESVKVNHVVVDEARLDGGENSSEYWDQLSRRKKEPMGNQESSELSSVLTNGLVPVEQIQTTQNHVVPLEEVKDEPCNQNCTTNTEPHETVVTKEPKKKKMNRKTSVDVQSSVQVSSSSRRMSEVPKSNTSSGATSPEYGIRRDSGTLSPLAFNSIQDKISALSKESSTVDVPKKKPKVNKLDESILAAVKEPVKEKPKEVIKVLPKIDSLLQSKISKFGEPSKGAKIPKKLEMKSFSGGLSFVEPKETNTMTPTRTRKLKPMAPQPPGLETLSVPSTPSSDRKVKKIKEKAPQPPGTKQDLTCLSNEVSNLLEMTELFSKQIQEFATSQPQKSKVLKEGSRDESQAVPEIAPETPSQPARSTPETAPDPIPETALGSMPEPSKRASETAPSSIPEPSKLVPETPPKCKPATEEKPVNHLALVPFQENPPETVKVPNIALTDFLALQVNGNNENEEFEDCVTPKASRKLLNLYNDDHSEWSIVEESMRVRDELQRMSKRLGGSSGSESFHTPSPKPVMYTSRGEVIGMKIKEQSPEWTPSPERELFTPEGSPLSDFSDASYDHYVASVDFSVRSVSLPRRVYPQAPRPMSYHEDWKEDSPVVINAGLSFDLCSRRTPIRQHLRSQPAFSEPKTASNSLSCKIAEFLNRTDHVMEEWRRLGRSDPNEIHSLVELPTHRINGTLRSKSAANIMIKGFQYFSRGSSRASWRSPSISKYSEASDRTLADLEELNELTADLSEERLSGVQLSERLDAETSERIRLEQELSQVSTKKSQLEHAAERLELELHYAKAYDNGLSDAEDFAEGRDDGDVYKRKCARLKRENDMLRQQLRQQHEDDLEQLVGLKKQLEKRLADANEEIDEQRQVAAEWKRKSQKLQAELNDFRIIVEEQSSRNSLLEKKQRKFDTEIQMLQDELRAEKNAKERFSRDRDVAMSNKCSVEQALASVRMELEQKEEEVRRLTQELDDMTLGGASEQDVNQLRKSKHDLDKKLKEQEDELDDLAGQLSLLESAKLKLEMSIENMRKEHRKEIAQKDDELEEARSNAIKKLKSSEAALEQEYEERSMLLRSKHELERRLKEYEEQDRSSRAADEDALIRLRKDLRKTKALLRDAQAMLDRAKEDGPGKSALRALKNQLDDSEVARESAVKAKQKLLSELNEQNAQLEDANRLRNEAESRAQASLRQMNTLKGQLEENEEELAEVMKKYHQHLASEETRNQEAASLLADVESERNSLREQLAEAIAKLEAMSVVDTAPDMHQRRLEVTIHDLKSRLELDATMRKRMEVHVSRLKEKTERLNEECTTHRAREEIAMDQVRRLQVNLREVKEQLAMQIARDQEAIAKRKELEKKIEAAELAESAARTEAKLCMQRVQDLQSALIAEIGSESEDLSDAESS